MKQFIYSFFISISLFGSHFPVDIYFVRHGKTIKSEFNEPKNVLTPLSFEGIQQSKDFGNRFKDKIIYKVYSSPNTRTKQTTHYALDQFPGSIQSRYNSLLKEGYKGNFQYKPSKILRRLMKDFRKHHCSTREEWIGYKVDGSVESYHEMYLRLQTFLNTVFIPQVTQEMPPGDSCSLFITHGMFMAAILYHHLPYDNDLAWSIKNCGWIKMRLAEDGSLTFLDYDKERIYSYPFI